MTNQHQLTDQEKIDLLKKLIEEADKGDEKNIANVLKKALKVENTGDFDFSLFDGTIYIHSSELFPQVKDAINSILKGENNFTTKGNNIILKKDKTKELLNILKDKKQSPASINLVNQPNITIEAKKILDEYIIHKFNKYNSNQQERGDLNLTQENILKCYKEKKPFIIMTSDPNGLYPYLDPKKSEQNFRNSNKIKEPPNFFIINNCNNMHWDCSYISNNNKTTISSSGNKNSCGAYTLANIIKKINNGEAGDANSSSPEDVRKILYLAIEKEQNGKLKNIPKEKITESITRIKSLGVMLDSNDIRYACMALDIPYYEASDFNQQLQTIDDFRTTISENLKNNDVNEEKELLLDYLLEKHNDRYIDLYNKITEDNEPNNQQKNIDNIIKKKKQDLMSLNNNELFEYYGIKFEDKSINISILDENVNFIDIIRDNFKKKIQEKGKSIKIEQKNNQLKILIEQKANSSDSEDIAKYFSANDMAKILSDSIFLLNDEIIAIKIQKQILAKEPQNYNNGNQKRKNQIFDIPKSPQNPSPTTKELKQNELPTNKDAKNKPNSELVENPILQKYYNYKNYRDDTKNKDVEEIKKSFTEYYPKENKQDFLERKSLENINARQFLKLGWYQEENPPFNVKYGKDAKELVNKKIHNFFTGGNKDILDKATTYIQDNKENSDNNKKRAVLLLLIATGDITIKNNDKQKLIDYIKDPFDVKYTVKRDKKNSNKFYNKINAYLAKDLGFESEFTNGVIKFSWSDDDDKVEKRNKYKENLMNAEIESVLSKNNNRTTR